MPLHSAAGTELQLSLRDDVVGNGAVDVGQAEVASGVTIGQLLVVEAHQVQNRGVKIMNVHALIHCSKAEVIASPVNGPAFYSAACQPHGEAMIVVIPAFGSL